MEIIKQDISTELKDALQALDLDYFKTSDNTLINHRLFYCNTWTEEDNALGVPIIELLKRECSHLQETFAQCTLIQLNVINAPPDCNTQLFHIDYQGDSVSYFVPFVDLSDLNGTEFVYFYKPENYELFYTHFLGMSDAFLNQGEAIASLKTLHLELGVDYCFKCANSNAYSLLYMPYYLYHRGQKNKTNVNRMMLNILFSRAKQFKYADDKYILDAEIDEPQRAQRILDLRRQQQQQQHVDSI